jgi:hypothetical protein
MAEWRQKVNRLRNRLRRPIGLWDVETLHSLDSRLTDGGEVVSQPAVLYPGNIPGIYFCLRLGTPQGHSAADRIRSVTCSNIPTYSTILIFRDTQCRTTTSSVFKRRGALISAVHAAQVNIAFRGKAGKLNLSLQWLVLLENDDL